MEHSNSSTFHGLSGPGFFSKFKDFQGLLKDPMNPGFLYILNLNIQPNMV